MESTFHADADPDPNPDPNVLAKERKKFSQKSSTIFSIILQNLS